MTKVIKRKIELPKRTFVKYSESKPGQTLVVGEFLGSQSVQNYQKTMEVPLHVFNTDSGEVCLNSSRELDNLLQQVEIGQIVDVTFLGKEKIKNKAGLTLTQNKFEVSILEKA